MQINKVLAVGSFMINWKFFQKSGIFTLLTSHFFAFRHQSTLSFQIIEKLHYLKPPQSFPLPILFLDNYQ
jgi:hypothetical protein